MSCVSFEEARSQAEYFGVLARAPTGQEDYVYRETEARRRVAYARAATLTRRGLPTNSPAADQRRAP